MRLGTALGLLVLLGASARATCPPDCVGGGGPAATDCFVSWSASTTATCMDGDPACDADGTINGTCLLGVQGCINAPLPGCTPGPLAGAPTVKPASSPAAQQLASAFQGLDLTTPGCTPPGLPLPLKVALAGIKKGKAKLTVTASAGGKRDKDKLRLTCLPNSTGPSLARDVQPIFTARCATPTCHLGPAPSGEQSLEAGRAWAESVNVRSTASRLPRVKPRSIRGSLLARKIIPPGNFIPSGGGAFMPSGCPGFPPAGGCLTDEELFTILAWIAAGALDN